MTLVPFKYLNVLDGVITMCFIELEISFSSSEKHCIIINTETIPFKSQGGLEAGFKHWNSSAKQALEIALENFNPASKLHIIVNKLEGRLLLDTNNASIGITCILGLKEYLSMETTSDEMKKMHQFVKDDWKNEPTVIPNFNNIFE